ncbi:hypothetical protein GEMRC1_009534 [Eukaryota sp. GEM-RC1]
MLGCVDETKDDSCPVCREKIPQTPLRINIALQEVIEIFKESSKAQAVCFECEEASPTLFCSECDAFFCHECSKSIHKPKSLRSHNVLSLDEQPSLSSHKCPRHPAKSLEHFCTKCSVSLCDSCVIHMGHAHHNQDLIPLDQARQVLEGQVKEFQVLLSNSTSQVSRANDEMHTVVTEVLTNTQAILHELVINWIRQSSQKMVKLDTGHTVNWSLIVDETLADKGNKFIDNALIALQSIKEGFNDAVQNANSFSLKLASKLTKKDLIDCNKSKSSSNPNETLNISEVSDNSPVSMSQLKESISGDISAELKLSLLNSFINHSQSIVLSEFNWIREHHPEFTSKMLEKLELFALNKEDFLSLIRVSVDYSSHTLLSKLIDLFSFETVPETLDISCDLLSKLTFTGTVSHNKEIWLDKVIRKNVPRDHISEISRNLLGRELETSSGSMSFSPQYKNADIVISNSGKKISYTGSRGQRAILGDKPLEKGGVYKWKVKWEGTTDCTLRVGIVPFGNYNSSSHSNVMANSKYMCQSNKGKLTGKFSHWKPGDLLELTADMDNYIFTIQEINSRYINMSTKIDDVNDVYYPFFKLSHSSQVLEIVD